MTIAQTFADAALAAASDSDPTTLEYQDLVDVLGTAPMVVVGGRAVPDPAWQAKLRRAKHQLGIMILRERERSSRKSASELSDGDDAELGSGLGALDSVHASFGEPAEFSIVVTCTNQGRLTAIEAILKNQQGATTEQPKMLPPSAWWAQFGRDQFVDENGDPLQHATWDMLEAYASTGGEQLARSWRGRARAAFARTNSSRAHASAQALLDAARSEEVG